MDEKKQIDEITKILDSDCEGIPDTVCQENSCSSCKAKQIIGVGYRKQSDVIDEFVKRLKKAPIKCALPLFGLSTKGEIEDYFDDIMLQVRDAIDGIAKEMKGGAE